MTDCQICGKQIPTSKALCERCELSIFQVGEILQIYIHETPPPNWLVKAVGELGWVFREYPRTKGYLNTAVEVTWLFTLEGLDEVNADDIKEINQSGLPRDKILTILEEALIIERQGDKIYPGSLVKKLRQVRWEGYQMDTPQVQSKFLELHGILTVALTNSLIKDGAFIPRRALAIFHILSENMIRSGEDLEQVIPSYVFEIACKELSYRQQRHVKWVMSGFIDGQTKIISDITDQDEMTLKDAITQYCQRMRERWRVREREDRNYI